MSKTPWVNPFELMDQEQLITDLTKIAMANAPENTVQIQEGADTLRTEVAKGRNVPDILREYRDSKGGW